MQPLCAAPGQQRRAQGQHNKSATPTATQCKQVSTHVVVFVARRDAHDAVAACRQRLGQRLHHIAQAACKWDQQVRRGACRRTSAGYIEGNNAGRQGCPAGCADARMCISAARHTKASTAVKPRTPGQSNHAQLKPSRQSGMAESHEPGPQAVQHTHPSWTRARTQHPQK